MSEGATFLNGQFCWNELGTTDSAGAKSFYTQLFGWTAEDHEMVGADSGVYTMMKLDGKDVCGTYELVGPMFEGVPPHWTGYVRVESVDAVAEEAPKHGGAIRMPPMDIPGVGRMAMITDPQGAVCAIFQPAEHCGSAYPGNAPGGFCWNELMTTDPEAARTFYSNILPWTPVTQQMGPTEYTMLMVGEVPAGGLMRIPPEAQGMPPHWMSYVTVEDCDASCSKATELGARLCAPPMDIPDIGRFAVLTDPQGATFSVIALANPQR